MRFRSKYYLHADNMTKFQCKIVLLPGLDGTGALFDGLREQLPEDLDLAIVRYPHDQALGYEELRPLVVRACENAPSVVLFAESFSSPLAIEIAATGLDNLTALILCTGFAEPPVSALTRALIRAIKLPLSSPPDWAIRQFLVGSKAPAALVQHVKQTICSVAPEVLQFRLNQILALSAIQSMAEVSVPTLYLQATEDRLVHSSAFKRIAHVNPKVVCHPVQGPHLLAQANPSGVATAVMSFIHTLA